MDTPPPTTNRHRSMLFRHQVQIADAAELVDARISTRADDGVVVYVNGVEVGRDRMPIGSISSSSYATAAPRTSAATATPTVFEVPAGLLHDGVNTIAASTHLNYRGTADASFDLILSATRTGEVEPPAAPAAPVASATATHQAVNLTWAPGDVTPVAQWSITRDGLPLTTVPGSTLSLDDPGLVPETTYMYGVRARGATGLESSATVVTVTTAAAPTEPVPVVLLSHGSAWRWIYRLGAWPTGWTSPSFDETSWATGAAPLGFGAPGLATTVDVPPPSSNRPLSALFRRTIDIADADVLQQIVLTTRADDGIVVYVNGVEVGRANMPVGTVGPSTYATAAPRTTAAPVVSIPLPASAFRDGPNTIAASVHLNYRATRDVTFEAQITAVAPR